MSKLLISASARRDVSDALMYTSQRWGPRQRRLYRSLIQQALDTLLVDPLAPASRARDDIAPGIRIFHIARHGRPARHFVVYTVMPQGDVRVIRLLHDAMDLPDTLSGRC